MKKFPAFVVIFLLVLPGVLQAAPPNIVFIMADDLGWTDLASYGSGFYETPHLDRFCKQGMKFSNAYTNGPNCQPTRAALLSGQYSPRTGVYTVGSGERGKEEFRKLIPVRNRPFLQEEVVTIAESLKKAGYQTGCFGKWHLGTDEKHLPLNQGFDEEVHRAAKKPDKNDKETHPATKYIAESAVNFIHKNKDKPFFAYVPFHAVHTPIISPEKLTQRFQNKAKPEGATETEGHRNAQYAGMLLEMDRGIGKILKALKELHLEEKTIVFFYSDNGGLGGYERAGVLGAQNISDNAPLRGGKGMLYEGGIRVPLIVRWKNHIEEGSECHVPLLTVDFYPTLLELANADAPEDQVLDGTSLVALFKNGDQANWKERPIYWHFPGYLQSDTSKGYWRTTPAGAIRYGDYKLIEFFETGKRELYDLKNDIGETVDLSQKEPEMASKLYQMLTKWRSEVQAPMPEKKS